MVDAARPKLAGGTDRGGGKHGHRGDGPRSGAPVGLASNDRAQGGKQGGWPQQPRHELSELLAEHWPQQRDQRGER
jgi:hypothetical protein